MLGASLPFLVLGGWLVEEDAVLSGFVCFDGKLYFGGDIGSVFVK